MSDFKAIVFKLKSRSEGLLSDRMIHLLKSLKVVFNDLGLIFFVYKNMHGLLSVVWDGDNIFVELGFRDT